MPTLEELLAPIDEERRCGADISYDNEYSELATLRQYHEENNPNPDYTAIAEACGTLLQEKSKDLTIALWYTEARLHLDGFGGLHEGVKLVHGLVDGFWDCVFPESVEDRGFTLEFLGDGLASKSDRFEPIKAVPLTAWRHSLHQFEESRGFKKDAFKAPVDPKAKKKAESEDVDPHAPTSENFEAAFTETPKARYKVLKKQLTDCSAAVKELEGLVEKRFKEAALPRPSFAKLKEALDKVGIVVDILLKKKLELEPDPPEVVAAEAQASSSDASVSQQPAPAGGLSPEPVDAADAQRRIAAAARFLRRADPTNPAPYLMLRGLRWGEIRKAGGLDVRLLEAPATELRRQLKSLLLASDWTGLLDAAEEVMAGPYGRGWLDLQRYVMTALEGLGGSYRDVAESIRQELVLLLRDVPELIQKTLMDDTPTANAETLQWLKMIGAQGGDSGKPTSATAPDYDSERVMAEATHEKALEWVASGNPIRGFELLKLRAEREQSHRARFVTESLAASVLVDAGMGAVARPMLENLVERITKQNLEVWESGAVVAKPLGLLYRCLPAADKRRTQLYEQICRLDPVLAITLGNETDGRAARPAAQAQPHGANEPTAPPQNSSPVTPGSPAP